MRISAPSVVFESFFLCGTMVLLEEEAIENGKGGSSLFRVTAQARFIELSKLLKGNIFHFSIISAVWVPTVVVYWQCCRELVG